MTNRKTPKATAKPKAPEPPKAPNPVIQALFDTTQAMAKAMAGIKAEPCQFQTKELEIAKHIKKADFGCQRENVAKLMEMVTGLPIVDAYQFVGTDPGEGNIPLAMRKAGAVLVVIESAEVGLVWKDEAKTLRRGDRGDLHNSYDTSKVRPATMEEIIAYVRSDSDYIRKNIDRYMRQDTNPLAGL